MARAYACDRCGDLFAQNEFEDFVPVILESGIVFNTRFRNIAGTYLTFCPKCRASFQKWWDEGAVHKTIDPKYHYTDTLYEIDEGENNA